MRIRSLINRLLPPGNTLRRMLVHWVRMVSGRRVYQLERLSGRAWRRWLIRRGEPAILPLALQAVAGSLSAVIDCRRLQDGTDLCACLMGSGQSAVFLALDDLVVDEVCLTRMGEMVHVGKVLVYGDDDRLDGKGCRLRPRLRPHYSRILFENIWYLGELVACQRERLLAFCEASGPDLAALSPREILSRFVLGLADREIGHCAQIVAHLGPGASTRDWYRHQSVPVPALPPSLDVSVIIPNRDQAGMLERCLDSLQKYSGGHRLEIVIVENGSREAATFALYERLRRDPSVRILEWKAPFNYAAINNMAAAASRSGLLLFLNNDVEARQAWLQPLAQYALRPEVGAVGAKLLYPSGRIQHAGMVLGMVGSAGHIFRFSPGHSDGYLGLLRFPRDAGALTGACIMMRRDVFTRVGGFDEELAVTCNDVDLCLRVHAAGLRVVWTPGTELVHHESVSRGQDDSPEKAARHAAEVDRLIARWGKEMAQFEPLAHPMFDMSREDVCLGNA